ncbi:glycosyltransferase [Ruegeria sp. R14_0]|uniref:glycosyltransferase family protein n=1 Tax=Ruegeria sp. R14_0 TaxID=2821100 RepID=UPI001ADC8CA2|nr:glycosyltransferase [Ruegeria sp. R14_0]MBO9445927.1 glycosyltransferase family 1 protein [Ruegeria sp. R14_0]
MTSPAASIPASRELLIFSQRNLNDNVSRCSGFEFEDVLAEIETAQIIAPRRARERQLPYDPKRWLSKRTDLFRHWPSGVQKTRLDRDYDLFFCDVQKPQELLVLDAIPNWRERCGLAICVLEEVWTSDLERHMPLVRTLADFDLIGCAFAETCEALQRITGKPVIHLPGAADMVRFAPDSLTADRPIDVYCMGRRRPEIHERLLKVIKERAGFYLYDSATKPPIAADHAVHRDLLANLVQHTKLFMVDIAKIGHADQKRGNVAWGPRHVEGIAGGAAQIGYAPESEDYRRYFDWPESVVRLSEDPDEAISQVVALLDDPTELDRMRRINLAGALAKHDWLHRWAQLLDHLNIAHSEGMARRSETLSQISARLSLADQQIPAAE